MIIFSITLSGKHMFLCCFGREQTHKYQWFVSLVSCFVLNVCLIPQHHPACRPACMPPFFIPNCCFGPHGYVVQLTLCFLYFFFFLSLSKHLVEHPPRGRCVWVERASGGATEILQSELVPWIELHKAHSLPSRCTHEHQLNQRWEQIPIGSTEFRTEHWGNKVFSKDYRLVLKEH